MLFELFKNIYSLLINEPNGTINYCNSHVCPGVTAKDLLNTKTSTTPVQFLQLTNFVFYFTRKWSRIKRQEPLQWKELFIAIILIYFWTAQLLYFAKSNPSLKSLSFSSSSIFQSLPYAPLSFFSPSFPFFSLFQYVFDSFLLQWVFGFFHCAAVSLHPQAHQLQLLQE